MFVSPFGIRDETKTPLTCPTGEFVSEKDCVCIPICRRDEENGRSARLNSRTSSYME